MTLLEECTVALGNSAIVLSKEETNKIFDNMTNIFPISSWGRIDWANVKRVEKISSSHDISKYINNSMEDVYILWSDANLPSIKTNLSNILNSIDDVTAVTFDTWLYNPNNKCVIEFYHEGEITIGWM